MTTTNPDNNYINVDHSTGAIADHFLMTNKGIIIGFFILLVFEALEIALTFILHLPTNLYALMMVPLIPFLILLALWPYGLYVRVDKLNQSIRFRKRCLICGVWNCKDKSFRLEDVSGFTIAKVPLLGKRYYTIYLHFKSGAPQEAIITGQDNSCRLEYDPELDNIPIMLNSWIRI